MGLQSTPRQYAEQLVHSVSVRRSDGPLSKQALSKARMTGIKLSFDPAQNGWVRADAQNDFDPLHVRPGWPRAKTGDALSFRQWTQADAPLFRTLLNNPKVWTFLPAGYPGEITLDAARDLISLAEDETLHIVRAICLDGLPVGQVRLEFRGQEPELSYWLGEPFWRKGIGRRAVSLFVKERFAADPGLDRMIARVKPGNWGSLQILEKSGFIRERESVVAPDWIILLRRRQD